MSDFDFLTVAVREPLFSDYATSGIGELTSL